jgi:transcriptional regulator with XRE-family HTH domain
MVAQLPLDAMLARYGLDRQKLSDSLGITREAVRKWAIGTTQPSIDNAMRAEALLNLPRHELRPDVWSPQMLPSPPVEIAPSPPVEIGPGPVGPAQAAPAPRRRSSPGRPAGASSAG